MANLKLSIAPIKFGEFSCSLEQARKTSAPMLVFRFNHSHQGGAHAPFATLEDWVIHWALPLLSSAATETVSPTQYLGRLITIGEGDSRDALRRGIEMSRGDRKEVATRERQQLWEFGHSEYGGFAFRQQSQTSNWILVQKNSRENLEVPLVIGIEIAARMVRDLIVEEKFPYACVPYMPVRDRGMCQNGIFRQGWENEWESPEYVLPSEGKHVPFRPSIAAPGPAATKASVPPPVPPPQLVAPQATLPTPKPSIQTPPAAPKPSAPASAETWPPSIKFISHLGAALTLAAEAKKQLPPAVAGMVDAIVATAQTTLTLAQQASSSLVPKEFPAAPPAPDVSALQAQLRTFAEALKTEALAAAQGQIDKATADLAQAKANLAEAGLKESAAKAALAEVEQAKVQLEAAVQKLQSDREEWALLEEEQSQALTVRETALAKREQTVQEQEAAVGLKLKDYGNNLTGGKSAAQILAGLDFDPSKKGAQKK